MQLVAKPRGNASYDSSRNTLHICRTIIRANRFAAVGGRLLVHEQALRHSGFDHGFRTACFALIGTAIAQGWGDNRWGQVGDDSRVSRENPVLVKGLGTGILSISAGHGGAVYITGNHSMALKFDGTVWAWGMNNRGQLGNKTRQDSSLPVQVLGL